MSDDDGWLDAGDVEQCAVGSGTEVMVADRIVALFRTVDGWLAMNGTCPHHGGPLGKGRLDGCVVTCPWHGWRFDVRDGTYQHASQAKHPTFATRVASGRVQIRLDES